MLDLTKRECVLLRIMLESKLEELHRDGGATGDTTMLLLKVMALEEKLNTPL